MSGRKQVVLVTGASRFALYHLHVFTDLISTITRGIGLAVATSLLVTFNAIVVAIQRTRTPELLDLLKKHPSTLLLIDGDVYVENKLNYKSILTKFY